MREIKQKDLELRLENIEIAILELARGIDAGHLDNYKYIFNLFYRAPQYFTPKPTKKAKKH